MVPKPVYMPYNGQEPKLSLICWVIIRRTHKITVTLLL